MPVYKTQVGSLPTYTVRPSNDKKVAQRLQELKEHLEEGLHTEESYKAAVARVNKMADVHEVENSIEDLTEISEVYTRYNKAAGSAEQARKEMTITLLRQVNVNKNLAKQIDPIMEASGLANWRVLYSWVEPAQAKDKPEGIEEEVISYIEQEWQKSLQDS